MLQQPLERHLQSSDRIVFLVLVPDFQTGSQLLRNLEHLLESGWFVVLELGLREGLFDVVNLARLGSREVLLLRLLQLLESLRAKAVGPEATLLALGTVEVVVLVVFVVVARHDHVLVHVLRELPQQIQIGPRDGILHHNRQVAFLLPLLLVLVLLIQLVADLFEVHSLHWVLNNDWITAVAV